MPRNFRGLQITGFFCRATTVGCFGLHGPACWVGGLAINLLLLFGVASIEELTVLVSGRGENTFENRLTFDVSLKNKGLGNALSRFDSELIGVPICKLGSGRNVAMETLLFGCNDAAIGSEDGLTAKEILRGPRVPLVFGPMFSSPSLCEDCELGRREWKLEFFLA